MSSQALTSHLPLIAILRGITPHNVLSYADMLITAGFTMLEVPLNSPQALVSIRLLVKTYGNAYLIGAGTVTNTEQVESVINCGANLVVTPNYNEDVVKISVAAGCHCYPGVITPTEAFAAIAAGASGLKLFPISMMGVEGFKALKSVLPPEIKCFPVGGITAQEESMYPYLSAGAHGFGLGSALFKPEMTLQEVEIKAEAFVSIYKNFLKSSIVS
ncbi:2-dehydro-3-deoxy-6-phosphogalactonate aldolase [Glaciecola petra]|uniref:2-dehydro-3-deoxy-6-phosphogalactonate aldolase n=1 Tax=Glaciecola petra TaxID=3075602 RepID=A0ABU2ZQU7_9ALTE|nr:2-dehydro-3-deoxy-6-phosphogalactonate aldolase [Aestuariibacter sp. P117]MDT0595000.1 2-dehydro-3-deoxy-6-phosphogalactonate aldolase [Aestuariibacter sp. P117]